MRTACPIQITNGWKWKEQQIFYRLHFCISILVLRRRVDGLLVKLYILATVGPLGEQIIWIIAVYWKSASL